MSILSVRLLLGACALTTPILAAACDPVPAGVPAARSASAPAVGESPEATTATTPNWHQLQDFLTGYTCASTPSCATSDAFMLTSKTAGPAAPLYSTGANVKTPELIASATKMPAAAAILTALYESGYKTTDTVDTIITNYVDNPKNKADTSAPLFRTAWSNMEKAASAKYNVPVAIQFGQLLSMTSGFTTLSPKDVLYIPKCMLSLTGTNPSSPDDAYTHTSLATCATEIADVKYIRFQPGTMFGYSYASYQVAGYLATLMSGHAGASYGGDWIGFFNATIVTPLGLQTYSYSNDLYINPTQPSPKGTNVTNPRISGGASSDAYDYSTILTAILVNDNKVIPSTVVSWLTTNQLPKQLPPGWIKSPPDDGMNPDFVYDIPLGLDPQAAAPFVQGYSFGLFIPTSKGLNDTGFLVSLNDPTTPNGKNALTPSALTQPHNATMIFLDPGLNGTVGWFDVDPASTFAAINLIYENGGDTDLVGLDMMRTANSAISCQFQTPGLVAPFPSPINGSYCAASTPPPVCTPGEERSCCSFSQGCGCAGQQTCGTNGQWKPLCVGSTLPGVPCP